MNVKTQSNKSKKNMKCLELTLSLTVIVILSLNLDHAQGLTDEESFKIEEYYHAGDNHYDLDDFEKALEYYDKALDLDPDYIDILYSKGLTLYKLDRFQESIQYFDRILEYNPRDTDAMFDRALALEKIGEESKARQIFERILEIKPDDINAKGRLTQTQYTDIEISWEEFEKYQSVFFIIITFGVLLTISLLIRARFLRL